MFTLGHEFVPPAIHAGGLRYHGDAPLLSKLVKEGYIEAVAYRQNDVFAAARFFAETEGIIVAPESAHGIKGVIDEALRCKKEGEEEVILFNNSGHGHFDLAAYDAYLDGRLEDYEYPLDMIEKSLAKVPKVE
jgi:tryptophan synthase beta chain